MREAIEQSALSASTDVCKFAAHRSMSTTGSAQHGGTRTADLVPSVRQSEQQQRVAKRLALETPAKSKPVMERATSRTACLHGSASESKAILTKASGSNAVHGKAIHSKAVHQKTATGLVHSTPGDSRVAHAETACVADVDLAPPGELRIDPADGNAYSRAEFIDEYGGTKEWDLAQPVVLARAHVRASGAASHNGASHNDASTPSLPPLALPGSPPPAPPPSAQPAPPAPPAAPPAPAPPPPPAPTALPAPPPVALSQRLSPVAPSVSVAPAASAVDSMPSPPRAHTHREVLAAQSTSRASAGISAGISETLAHVPAQTAGQSQPSDKLQGRGRNKAALPPLSVAPRALQKGDACEVLDGKDGVMEGSVLTVDEDGDVFVRLADGTRVVVMSDRVRLMASPVVTQSLAIDKAAAAAADADAAAAAFADAAAAHAAAAAVAADAAGPVACDVSTDCQPSDHEPPTAVGDAVVEDHLATVSGAPSVSTGAATDARAAVAEADMVASTHASSTRAVADAGTVGAASNSSAIGAATDAGSAADASTSSGAGLKWEWDELGAPGVSERGEFDFEAELEADDAAARAECGTEPIDPASLALPVDLDALAPAEFFSSKLLPEVCAEPHSHAQLLSSHFQPTHALRLRSVHACRPLNCSATGRRERSPPRGPSEASLPSQRRTIGGGLPSLKSTARSSTLTGVHGGGMLWRVVKPSLPDHGPLIQRKKSRTAGGYHGQRWRRLTCGARPWTQQWSTGRLRWQRSPETVGTNSLIASHPP